MPNIIEVKDVGVNTKGRNGYVGGILDKGGTGKWYNVPQTAEVGIDFFERGNSYRVTLSDKGDIVKAEHIEEDAPSPATLKKKYGSVKTLPSISSPETEKPMTKDDYWRRREERDIVKEKHISRQGAVQNASVSLAYIGVNTLTEFDKVSALADKMLEYVNK